MEARGGFVEGTGILGSWLNSTILLVFLIEVRSDFVLRFLLLLLPPLLGRDSDTRSIFSWSREMFQIIVMKNLFSFLFFEIIFKVNFFEKA